MHDLPPDIGPHEDIEFELMRQGQKDVALFSDYEPEGLDEILREGFYLLEFSQTLSSGVSYKTRIVFRKGYEHFALQLRDMVESGSGATIDPVREHKIGKILSYTTEQVEAYLRHASQV